MDIRKLFGKSGEDIAVSFLKKSGYSILERNYRCKFGEIDIIASNGSTLCFIEVKARSSGKFGVGAESVITSKQKKIINSANNYINEKNISNILCRFDVISIDTVEGRQIINHIENAFLS